MNEILYDEKTLMYGKYPEIKKLGVCSTNGEMTPFVWKGRLMRMELVDPSFGTNAGIPRQAGIRDVETGKFISFCAPDVYFHSGYFEEDTAYILGVDMKRRDTIRIYESHDLVNWTDRDLFTNPGWVYYNTGLTKSPDGYAIILESSSPKEYNPNPFTHFFATSPDLKTWTHLDPERCSLTKERYHGGPWLRYSDGWYYAFAVEMYPCRIFTNHIFRTKDFENWYAGHYNPVLMPSNEDKLISAHACDIDEDTLKRIETAYNCNNSDIDMCDWNGKTYINYLCGNQYNFYWMCEAEFDGTVAEFLKSYFE